MGKSSRSGNTSGLPQAGTLASSATRRAKAYARAQQPPWEKVAEVATLRAHQRPELLRVPLHVDHKRVLVRSTAMVKSSRSGNTSGTPKAGTLASSATRKAKAYAQAQQPTWEKVAEVATLRASRRPGLLRVPLQTGPETVKKATSSLPDRYRETARNFRSIEGLAASKLQPG